MTGYIESRGQIQSQLAQFGARTEHLESKISEKRSALKTIDHKVQYLLRRDEYARRWKQQFRGMMLALIAGMGVLVALLAYR